MSTQDDTTLSVSATSLRGDLHFVSSSYQPFITIADDGSVTIADHLTVDEAAREFWNAVLRLNPMLRRSAAASADERATFEAWWITVRDDMIHNTDPRRHAEAAWYARAASVNEPV